MEPTFNYYELLGVSQEASAEEIRLAYRNCIAKYHPDVNDAPNADRLTAFLNQAVSVLQDPMRRAEYNASLASGAEEAGTDERDQSRSERSDQLLSILEDLRLTFIDKRPSGGALWVVGDEPLGTVLNAIDAAQYRFEFAKAGGRATRHQPGWFLRPMRKA
jgi:DnaJ-class molecular chaperone